MSIKAVFFDIDNTLYDSATLTAMARKNSVLAMMDAGLDIPEDRILRDLAAIIEKHGPNYPRHYDELLKLYGKNDPKIIAAAIVAYEHTKHAYLKPFPGVVPTLMILRINYRLGVISNGLTIKQWEKLVGLRLHHFFEAVVTSEECGFEKPSSEIFKKALEVLKIKPPEAVMVGDKQDVDVRGARNAGLQWIWLHRGEAKNLNETSLFTEIPKILDGLE